MSTRAYKIKSIETEKQPTFTFAFGNIVDHATTYYTSSSSGETSMLEFNRETVEEQIEELEIKLSDLPADTTAVEAEDLRDELNAWKRILADFDPEEDYVMYETY